MSLHTNTPVRSVYKRGAPAAVQQWYRAQAQLKRYRRAAQPGASTYARANGPTV